MRVLVVDDTADLRAVITLLLDMDGRFEVVGEAGDGIEGVELAGRLQPDVVLLDRSMPRLSGLEALPKILDVAPHAAVVLYTSEADERVYQAALGSGAAGVMDKTAGVADLAVHLSEALVRSWSDPDADAVVTVGPVPSESALEWIDNTSRIVAAVRAHPEVLDTPIDDDVYDIFDEYLRTWRAIAETRAEFVWAARAAPAKVHRLIEAWGTIDRIRDDDLHALGLDWTSPNGRVFFQAITSAILDALQHHEATLELARRLQPQWG